MVVLLEQWMAIPGLPGGLLIYQGYRFAPKGTPMCKRLSKRRKACNIGPEPCAHLDPPKGASVWLFEEDVGKLCLKKS